ncbi:MULTISPECIES: bifunctional precorrin-2 dehydrogenase/sirohydrochlorin ferrochelatase [Carboxydocella]|uniref:precorrin-2 dehydrogenase n=2 Tax=Carboxydocella TaxID=178898 RepID=A0A1T4RCL5_9FIRM|nr:MULTISPECIES: bifunctional precorrin-2 dehydrogenase/sirohydrochlorin ferrochelatase [Carboxydocella]AVX20861.1 precorrin-2 dehydrogenase / sirohydrochlorin ferrochelatase [Carboxydocella thermautotrophica]AVX31277.1 precorrin-2 dehydrogenase / sirohydrochlorin ferrochelatase [Carboxydocella thermautotrophica]SKA13715.1 precorrin-2 dehydrogenase / sirohydrochlorin ferrochelatase [Carboxydocella sporoproducens DSM 16521]GAW29972.1 siroheme synthase [Carboxydocella sp. ULO1]GAW30425.1 sirohem
MLYPIFLRLDGKKCLVVGGGQVAERKIAGLLQAGAGVLVVSPEVTERIEGWAGAGRVMWYRRLFQPDDVEQAHLVYAATDDAAVNARIARECQQRKIWVNVVDDPERGDFYLPAVLRRGHLQLAVSTGGQSPVFARKLRDHLARSIGPEYGEINDLLGELRQILLARIPDPGERQRIMEGLLAEGFWEDLVRGEMEKVKERIKNVFGDCWPQS